MTYKTASHPLEGSFYAELQGRTGPGRYNAAARAAIRKVERENPQAMDTIDDIASRVTFHRRRYGNVTYTWAYVGNNCIGDPHPAIRYPHAALRVDIAIYLSR